MRRASSRRLRRGALAVTVAGAALGLTGIAWAAFVATTSNPASSFSAKRIFPGLRTTSAWDFRADDGSGNGETNQSHVASFGGDGQERTTSAFSTAFASNRWLEFDFNTPLPAGLAVTGATFNFRHLPVTSTKSACFYFEVIRASTGALLATHGSSASPVACRTGSTYSTISTAIPSVTTTDNANDLRIRVYGWITGGTGEGFRIDTATVSGSTPYSSFTLYKRLIRDQATTIAATTDWSLYASGGSAFQSSNWPPSFSTSSYLKFTFPAYLPAGAVITSATFTHMYRSIDPGTCCTASHWLEIYAGATLIGTRGSSTSPYSSNSGSTYVTDTVLLPEVDTVAEANSIVIKMYLRQLDSAQSLHDLATVTINYYLN